MDEKHRKNILPTVLFTLVAILSFSVWAFGGKFFSSEPLMYAGCAVVFFGLGGLALTPGTGFQGKEIPRFCLAFALAYLAYAMIWSLAWFAIPQTFGEIMGSLLGLFAFAAILGKWMKLEITILVATAILFLFHSAGYYLGGFAYSALQGRGPLAVELPFAADTIRLLARLSWGLFYGIGLALGIGRILYLSRQSSDSPSTQI